MMMMVVVVVVVVMMMMMIGKLPHSRKILGMVLKSRKN
jgi:hypothetical protein